MQQFFFSILPTYLQQYLHDPHDTLKRCILCIDLHAVNILVSRGEMLSSPYFQGGIYIFLDENVPSYFRKKTLCCTRYGLVYSNLFLKLSMHGLEKIWKVYQHILCILFWISIICCTTDKLSIFIRNQASRVTCMDKVCQSIRLHLNQIILVLNNPFFNYFITFFRFYYINKSITD